MKSTMKAAMVLLAALPLVVGSAAFAQEDPGAAGAAQAQIATEQAQMSAQQMMTDAQIAGQQAQINMDQMTADPNDSIAALQIQMEQSQIDAEQAMEQAQIDAQQAALAVAIPN